MPAVKDLVRQSIFAGLLLVCTLSIKISCAGSYFLDWQFSSALMPAVGNKTNAQCCKIMLLYNEGH